ncbi:peptidase M28 [Cellulophaga algicola DSM 14237]|uniref:Carboxypeptidase Q n=1 Tax=Cellulophaga algicola (strain DSM 14237 / IC166 / ACAM 630) TaxID=688270 RepID=E6XA18_CELAD|nr:M20/M25/M40 family metallo-hydrolase [Cellulophaga algicola]ADV47708.1 peptidase M28 [Cellulophaga algicola DSM 14237]
MKKVIYFLSLFIITAVSAQKTDEEQLKDIYDAALTKSKAYDWLNYLSNQIGGRLSGSVQAQQAVDYTKLQLDELGLDKVWLQPVMVPKWNRGLPEFAYFESDPGVTTNVPICALGGSVATPLGGLKANVVEVKSLDDLAILGKQRLEGRIVFFNRPMDPTNISTFDAYSGCVDQRYAGAAEAAKYGAVGIIVRSMNLRLDDLPHTGTMSYGDLAINKRIPAAAISTNAADLLSLSLRLNPDISFYFKQNCEQFDDVQSYNVIGEIKGTTTPEEIMVVGGHLDSWDLGDGSHDDGAGCVQSMEVLHLLKESGYKPKRTIRVVLFMNEENGLRGGNKYAEVAKSKKEKHVFALESDSGGFTPRGFSFDCSEENFIQVQSWKPLFEPYLIHMFVKGHSGADIGPLKDDQMVLAGLRPDSQRYFDHHHAANDTFEHVNKRELELGAASMASLIYLFDKYGVIAAK